jgi:hypothetical protein
VKLPPPFRSRWVRPFSLFLLVLNHTQAQNLLYEKDYGVNVSLNFAIGSHFQRVGANLQLYYVNGLFQANSTVRAYFNLRAPGPRQAYPELLLSQGVVFGFGPTRSWFNPFFASISNQTNYEHSFSYSYNAWFNTVRTSQQTGIIAITVAGMSLLAENDILAAPSLDRFRTGAFLLQYQHLDQFQTALSCAIWTGQFGRKREIFLIKAFYNNCYMDTVGGRYTSLAHGLLSLQMKYNVGYGQDVQANLGIDSEQIRNVIQNRLMHNMRFLPDKLKQTKNCHLPMLDENGKVFLYGEGQKIRRAKLYWNLFSNANVFY